MATWTELDGMPPLVDGPGSPPMGYNQQNYGHWGPSGNANGSVVPGGFGATPMGYAAPLYATPGAQQQPALYPYSYGPGAAAAQSTATPHQHPAYMNTYVDDEGNEAPPPGSMYPGMSPYSYGQQQQQSLPPGTPYFPAAQYPDGHPGMQYNHEAWDMGSEAGRSQRDPWRTPGSSGSSTLNGDDGANYWKTPASPGNSNWTVSPLPGYASGPRVIYKRPEDWRRDFSRPGLLSRLLSKKSPNAGSSPEKFSLARNGEFKSTFTPSPIRNRHFVTNIVLVGRSSMIHIPLCPSET